MFPSRWKDNELYVEIIAVRDGKGLFAHHVYALQMYDCSPPVCQSEHPKTDLSAYLTYLSLKT